MKYLPVIQLATLCIIEATISLHRHLVQVFTVTSFLNLRLLHHL